MSKMHKSLSYSPKAGACCTNECKFINDTEKQVCQEDTECSFASYCKLFLLAATTVDWAQLQRKPARCKTLRHSLSSFVISPGKNGTCPKARHKPDNRICNNASNVCENGECKGSICSYYGLTQCPCSEMGYLCQVCCNTTVVCFNNKLFIDQLFCWNFLSMYKQKQRSFVILIFQWSGITALATIIIAYNHLHY